jgi:branched-chain amino acid transport system permease protein
VIVVGQGLALGAIYVLVAVTLNIVFLPSGVFNFAEPQILTFGTFVAYMATASLRVPVIVSLLLGAAICGALGLIVEVTAIHKLLASRSASSTLVTTVGASVAIEGVILVIWGTTPQTAQSFISDRIVTFLQARLTIDQYAIIALAIVLPALVALVTRKTLIGLSSLAAAEDRDAATLRGINVGRLTITSFLIAGAISGILGTVVASTTDVSYDLGDTLVLKAFLAMAIGGFGSQLGAVIGGFIVGLAEAIAGRYLGEDYTIIVLFVLLLAVLMLRPNGIFGRYRERVVLWHRVPSRARAAGSRVSPRYSPRLPESSSWRDPGSASGRSWAAR